MVGKIASLIVNNFTIISQHFSDINSSYETICFVHVIVSLLYRIPIFTQREFSKRGTDSLNHPAANKF